MRARSCGKTAIRETERKRERETPKIEVTFLKAESLARCSAFEREVNRHRKIEGKSVVIITGGAL